jgi:hypothetical protein
MARLAHAYNQDLFRIVMEANILTDIDNEMLAREILTEPKRLSDNSFNTQYEDTFFIPKAGSVGEQFSLFMDENARERGFAVQSKWAHIHQPLESTNTHNHIDKAGIVEASWCYYVATPEGSGLLTFILNEYDGSGLQQIKPEAGMLLIFPHWINHKVTKNMSNDVRISIAGNFRLAV